MGFTMVHNDYYVYIHRRGDNNEVFYVGKGRGARAKSKANRNTWWNNINNKCGFTVEYSETDMSEESAWDLEIELIKFYRENGHKLCNISSGGEGGGKGVPTTECTKNKMAEQGFSVLC